uniref:Uncharacterized protein n=1 Tax=Paulinella micropora TaxID=1928728 RepID=A0A385I191_9EUKA|nr:hypothetical protein PMNZ_773 [Paulinella micropora]AXY63693.1 hypothetical protein PMNZ_773 [Paulinella micropora]
MTFSAKLSASPGGSSLIALTDSNNVLKNETEYQYLSRQLSLMYQQVDPIMDPYKIVKELQSKRVPRLVILMRDMSQALGLSVKWLKVLGATQQPCILLVSDPDSDSIGNNAAAHQALLEQHGVPLVGILQIGGIWNPIERRCDGLSWCGWWQGLKASSESKEISELETIYSIRKRWSQVMNDSLLETQN